MQFFEKQCSCNCCLHASAAMYIRHMIRYDTVQYDSLQCGVKMLCNEKLPLPVYLDYV